MTESKIMPVPTDALTAPLFWDGLKTVASILILPALTWFLGRGAQKKTLALTERNADQKSAELLWKRVESLEARVEHNTDRIETLHGEKMELVQQITALKQQISIMEIKKEQYETNEIIHLSQIEDLKVRMAAKEQELHCAEVKLKELEAGPHH